MLLDRQKEKLNRLLKQYNYNFEYLRPAQKVQQVNHSCKQTDLFYWKDKNMTKRGKRRIFYQVQYQQSQIKAINTVKSELTSKNIFENFPDAFILKHLHAVDLSVPKALQRLQQLQTFHNSPVITRISQNTIESLQKGLIYTYGFSKNYIPIVILRIDRFDTKKPLQQNFNILYYLMLIVQAYKMKPYHNQKYIFLIDLNNMNLSDLPYNFIYESLTKLSLYYCGFTDKTFVFNAKGLGNMWMLIKNFLPQSSVKKVEFIDGNYDEIYKLVEAQQLQKRYGGSNQNLTEGEYWPPKATHKSHNYRQEEHEHDQTDFFSVMNHSHFFQGDLIHFEDKQLNSQSVGCCNGKCQIF